MQSCNRQGPAPTTANHHSIIEKRFLGVTIPPQTLETAAPEGDLRIAPDTLFNHPNVGPFISMPLIQRLVTSNPSPACVARIIGARSRLGVIRPVFFVSMGGFDSHDAQNRAHADLMARLSHALDYFDSVLGASRSQVTLFTASDFGRTFTSNGGGTDLWPLPHRGTQSRRRGRLGQLTARAVGRPDRRHAGQVFRRERQRPPPGMSQAWEPPARSRLAGLAREASTAYRSKPPETGSVT
jgi:hypothetical protein